MKKALALCLLLLCLPLAAGCSLQGIADAYGFALDTLSAMGLEVTQQVLGTREQGAGRHHRQLSGGIHGLPRQGGDLRQRLPGGQGGAEESPSAARWKLRRARPG